MARFVIVLFLFLQLLLLLDVSNATPAPPEEKPGRTVAENGAISFLAHYRDEVDPSHDVTSAVVAPLVDEATKASGGKGPVASLEKIADEKGSTSRSIAPVSRSAPGLAPKVGENGKSVSSRLLGALRLSAQKRKATSTSKLLTSVKKNPLAQKLGVLKSPKSPQIGAVGLLKKIGSVKKGLGEQGPLKKGVVPKIITAVMKKSLAGKVPVSKKTSNMPGAKKAPVGKKTFQEGRNEGTC
ncbi:hypothetical protein BC829DRAFT_429429 [Chytridium lagenaria]|nr:hypothetical protein BC829DRAFT_429429 [Chytridium lagenaria]